MTLPIFKPFFPSFVSPSKDQCKFKDAGGSWSLWRRGWQNQGSPRIKNGFGRADFSFPRFWAWGAAGVGAVPLASPWEAGGAATRPFFFRKIFYGASALFRPWGLLGTLLRPGLASDVTSKPAFYPSGSSLAWEQAGFGAAPPLRLSSRPRPVARPPVSH